MKEFKLRIELPWSVEVGVCYPIYGNDGVGNFLLIGGVSVVFGSVFNGFLCDSYESRSVEQGAPMYLTFKGWNFSNRMPTSFFLSDQKIHDHSVPVTPENLTEIVLEDPSGEE